MKKRYKIVLIVFGAVIFIWYGYVGAVKYKNWKWYQGMKKEAAKFEGEIADKKAKIVADTYGGETPQETLDLFISAVEKGDYELASKYFVVERQEEELKNLKSVPKENINNIIKLLKQAQDWRSSLEDKIFVMEVRLDSSPSLFINFIKYPSNIWKIDEI